MTNSVLRRYTPPTCTLEIKAKSSPLSRLVGESLVKDLQFELRFDDPRKPDESRVTVRGDRTGLDKLCDAVSTYVQDFLLSSPTELPFPNTNSYRLVEDDSEVNTIVLPASFVKQSESGYLTVYEATNPLHNDQDLEQKPPRNKLLNLPVNIYLQPQGLVSHNLFLGQLANEESGPVVQLSVLQLFDLATALDGYTAELVALPDLNRTRKEKAPPAWSWVAASMVLAVGVTAGTLKWRSHKPVQQAAAPTVQQSTPTPTPIAQVPIPPPPSPIPTPLVPSPLAASPKITPPTPVQPPPIPVQNSASVAPNNNQGSQRESTIIPDRKSAAKTTENRPTGIIQTTTPNRQVPNIGQTVPNRPIPNIGQTVPNRPIPNIGQTVPNRPIPNIGQTVPNRPIPNIGQTVPNRPIPNIGSTPQSKVPQNQPIPGKLSPTQQPELPILPSPIRSSRQPEIATGDISASGTAARSIPAPAALNPASSAPAAEPNDRLFDKIPQVGEARDYLQSRWKPPADLPNRLEYRLIIDVDGSIERIIPLGEAASKYIESTNIPAIGQRFVSPPNGEKKPLIRTVFNQDGTVETFLDN